MMNIPQEELYRRVTCLQQKMVQKQIEAVLIMDNTDLYYFAGTAQKAFLFLPAGGEPLLMVKKDYERAVKESNLKQIVPVSSMKQLTAMIREQGYNLPKFIGMELDVIPAADYFFYQKIFGDSKIIDCSSLIKQVRMVKSPYELELLGQTAKLHQKIFYRVAEVLREGIKDIEIAAEIEYLSRNQNHMGNIRFRGFNGEMFFATVLVGADAAVPSGYDTPLAGQALSPAFPMGCSGKAVKRGESVVVDCGGNYTGYIIDQTRVYVVGALPPELDRAHGISIEILEGIKQRAKAGTGVAEVYHWAWEEAKKYGLEENFMGYGVNRVSFIGHGVGLELNELPVLVGNMELVLEQGMVMAVEPKFVFPGIGSVGVEDTLVVTHGGMEPLADYYPLDLTVV
ncbi:MAG: aminopeptidase P family protein [Clostridia bacterium]|nr:aminopeptidase P family protein [Clostridia bacterium]